MNLHLEESENSLSYIAEEDAGENFSAPPFLGRKFN